MFALVPGDQIDDFIDSPCGGGRFFYFPSKGMSPTNPSAEQSIATIVVHLLRLAIPELVAFYTPLDEIGDALRGEIEDVPGKTSLLFQHPAADTSLMISFSGESNPGDVVKFFGEFLSKGAGANA